MERTHAGIGIRIIPTNMPSFKTPELIIDLSKWPHKFCFKMFSLLSIFPPHWAHSWCMVRILPFKSFRSSCIIFPLESLLTAFFFSFPSVPFKKCPSHVYRLYVTIPRSRYGVNAPLPKPCFLPALTWMKWGQSRLRETSALSRMRLLVDFWIMNDLFFLLRV